MVVDSIITIPLLPKTRGEVARVDYHKTRRIIARQVQLLCGRYGSYLHQISWKQLLLSHARAPLSAMRGLVMSSADERKRRSARPSN